jgi:predicted dehydrogenase
VVDGGAACLLTNGIHWIDFAIELFGSAPERVVSTAKGEAINPRSPDLMLYGGTALWSFGGGREAVISFNNGSSVAPRARIYLRNAVAELDGELNVVLRRRDMEAVQRFPKVTRTGAAVETLYEGAVPGFVEYLAGMGNAIREVRDGGPLTCDGADGAAAVTACVGALAASRSGRAEALPIDPDGAEGRQTWPIS